MRYENDTDHALLVDGWGLCFNTDLHRSQAANRKAQGQSVSNAYAECYTQVSII